MSEPKERRQYVRPSAEQTQVRPQAAYEKDEYQPGEWVFVCDMLRKEGRYGDGDFYLTGRAKGCTTVRWVVKPMRAGEFKFRRIPAHLKGKMFKLGYWQNVTDCADPKHRSNIRNAP